MTPSSTAAVLREPAMPRLAPIDRPRGLLQWLVRLVFRWRFGRVMMPLRVVYPRIPGFTFGHLWLANYSQRGLSLPPAIKHLIELRVSGTNRCSFCGDLIKAFALSDGHPEALLDRAQDPLDSAHFDAPTRAALGYVDELLRTGTVGDNTFDDLRPHFDERQIMEIVWLVAFTQYHNLMARPLGLVSDGFCDLVRDARN